MYCGFKSDNLSGNLSWCCLRYSRIAPKIKLRLASHADLSAGSRVNTSSVVSSAADKDRGKLRKKAASAAQIGMIPKRKPGSIVPQSLVRAADCQVLCRSSSVEPI